MRSVLFSQAYDDSAGLSSTVSVTMAIIPVNDKPHSLLLDGVQGSMNYQVNFTEEDDPVSLSQDLTIVDTDVGAWNFNLAVVHIANSEMRH